MPSEKPHRDARSGDAARSGCVRKQQRHKRFPATAGRVDVTFLIVVRIGLVVVRIGPVKADDFSALTLVTLTHRGMVP